MEQMTFKVDSLPNELRTHFKSHIEILAFRNAGKLESIDDVSNSFTWLLERVDIKIENLWLPLKEPGKDEYNPANISLKALQEIIFQMMKLMKDVFQKSNESSQK